MLTFRIALFPCAEASLQDATTATITLVSATHSVNPALHKSLGYDLVRDFAPISQVTSQPYCLTLHPSIPAKTVKEMIELIRAKPDFYTYGSSGTGGLSHLAGTLFASMGNVRWIHVPYKGGAAGISTSNPRSPRTRSS